MSGALQPPFYDPPIADYPSGQQHSQAWTEYLQSVADQLATLTARSSAVTDGSEATAGQVGEFKTVVLPLGSAVTLGSFTIIDITHLDLDPGDWDVWGSVVFQPAGGTTINMVNVWIAPTPATSVAGETAGYVSIRAAFVTGQPQVLATGHVRLLNAAAQPMYLTAQAGFGVSSMVAYGTLSARRVR